jgi:hypothetical protein
MIVLMITSIKSNNIYNHHHHHHHHHHHTSDNTITLFMPRDSKITLRDNNKIYNNKI